MVKIMFNSDQLEKNFMCALCYIGKGLGVYYASERDGENEVCFYDSRENALEFDSEDSLRNFQSICDVVRSEE